MRSAQDDITMPCEDLGDGIRTHTSAVGPHDGGREGPDLRCAEGGGDRNQETHRDRDGWRDGEGAGVDDVDDDSAGAGDSGLETTGEHTSACINRTIL